jgi:predicted RNA binding protein YcfA (HicA-like mRNA interferase family)
MKVRDLIKLVERDGWQHVRTTGSHRHFRHPEKPGTVTFRAILRMMSQLARN